MPQMIDIVTEEVFIYLTSFLSSRDRIFCFLLYFFFVYQKSDSKVHRWWVSSHLPQTPIINYNYALKIAHLHYLECQNLWLYNQK